MPLGRLGTVALAAAPRFTRYAARGQEAVLLNLMRQGSASTPSLSKAAHRWFQDHRDALPGDVEVETFYDQADLVRSAVRSVAESLLVGAVMAIGIVVLFLRSLRLGLAAAIVLPAAIGLTVLGLKLGGQSFSVPGNSSFDIEVTKTLHYVCHFG